MRLYIYIVFTLYYSSYLSQKEVWYNINNITVKGNLHTSEDAIITISKLKIGDAIKIPSLKIQNAIKILWNEGVFNDISIYKKLSDKGVNIIIYVKENLMIGSINIEGVTSSEKKDIIKKVSNVKRYSPYSLKIIYNTIENLLTYKGYKNTNLTFNAISDSSYGKINLFYKVSKGKRFKVGDIILFDNKKISSKNVVSSIYKLDDSKTFKKGKVYYNNKNKLKKHILDIYKDKGFLDVKIDSILENIEENKINYNVFINEGNNYKLNSIKYDGNNVFSTTILNNISNNLINKDYSKSKFESRMFFEEKKNDVTSMYLDNGYANLKLNFEENFIADNLVNINVFIEENKKYKFGNIKFKGNVRTKDKVLNQSVITHPGDVFSRSKIIASQNKLMQLDYFIPESLDVELKIDTVNKNVDVTYILEERISDKFLVSGGFDGSYLVGTLGFDFKNFELSDVFKKGSRWNPLPAGGGQHLSLKAQSDAKNYYGFSFVFEEPTLKNKQIGLGLSSDYAFYNDTEHGYLKLFSSQIGLSHYPIKNQPFLRLNHNINYRYYNPNKYSLFGFENGFFNSLIYKLSIVKNTTNNIYFPTKGTFIKLECSSSIPYSFIRNIDTADSYQKKYNWLEYYKLKTSIKWFKSINKKQKTIFAYKLGIGVLGKFSNKLDIVPFERFEMGGTGITNYNINANDIIGLRGYEIGSLSNNGGDPIAIKTSIELRQKIFSFEKWMFTSHLFYENGNTFNFGDVFHLNHSLGIGGKLYIPMLGVVGVDCGWGLNKNNFNWKSPTIQFTIGLDVGDF